MKKEKEDIPLYYFERNVIVIAVFAALTVICCYYTYKLFKEIDPRSFFMGVPSLVFGFQTLWLSLNPFAVIYEDKVEIKRTFFGSKFWYFIDIKSVNDITRGGFSIIYNDGEPEKISTFGIRNSHKKEFRDAVNKYVCKSLVERD